MAAKKNKDVNETGAELIEEPVRKLSKRKKTDESVTDVATDGSAEDAAPRKRRSKTASNTDGADETLSEPAKTRVARKKASDDAEVPLDKPAKSTTRAKKSAAKPAEEMASDAAKLAEEMASDDAKPADEQTSDGRTIAIDFWGPSTPKLTRKKGKIVKSSKPDKVESNKSPLEKPSFYAVQFEEQDKPSEAPFTPRKIALQPRFRILTLGSFDLDILNAKPSRRRGVKRSSLEREAMQLRYSGMIRIPVTDRAPVLRDLQLYPDTGEDAPLRPVRFLDFVRAYVNSPMGDGFRRAIQNVSKWNLISDWYGMSIERMLELRQAMAALRNAMTESSEPAPAEPGPDPVVAAIFDIFERPIDPLFLDSDDPEELRFFYSSNHAGQITSLFVDWARSLEYIDRGVFGGPHNEPLSVCFIERFQKILASDFACAEKQGIILPDAALKQRFYLDDIDLLLLWLMAGHEMDPNFRTAMRSTWDQQTVIYMSSSTLMRFFCITAFDRSDVMMRLSPSSPMAMAGLFKIVLGNVPTQPIAFEIIISEQIVRQFMGIRSLSVASTSYAELQFPHFSDDTFIAENHTKTFDIIQNYYTRPPLNLQPNLERENLDYIPSMAFLVEGLPGSGRTTLVKLLASRFKKPVIIVQSSPLTAIHPTDCEEYLKTVFTDAALMNAIICFRDSGPLLSEEKMAAVFARQLALRPVVCAFCVELAVKTNPAIEPYITFKTKMDANLKDNAVAFWTQHLKLPQTNQAKVDVAALSQRMALQPFQIQKATKLAYYSSNLTDEEIPITNAALEKAAAVQVTKNIGNLAFVSDPEIDLSDVIVSDDIMDKIRKIIGSAQNRRRVLYEWGLSKRIRRGTGVIALFDGEPGTGKTHSAEAIAHELGLSLMRINIATMVDKYIGETEKNLTTIFEQARPDMQLLLFDEADSLFTKRTSNVSKSNDRYSNMSVNVLLQLVERYEGVSILTTNLKNAIDPAFERRITYKVYFPMPKKPERERLWRYMCPPDIVTSEPIDYEWLSELEMSGGEIKNSVLTAAFTAATMGVLLNSEILYNAGVAEASAAGRVLRRYEEGDDFQF